MIHITLSYFSSLFVPSFDLNEVNILKCMPQVKAAPFSANAALNRKEKIVLNEMSRKHLCHAPLSTCPLSKMCEVLRCVNKLLKGWRRLFRMSNDAPYMCAVQSHARIIPGA